MLQLPDARSPLQGSALLLSVRAAMLGSSRCSRHCWAPLGKLGAHTSLALLWLWAVRFLSRGEDQHFDVQPRGLGEVSSLVVGFCAPPQV